jgi:hypothetical protein
VHGGSLHEENGSQTENLPHGMESATVEPSKTGDGTNNGLRTPFSNLPDELLLRIMDHSTPLSLYLLRQTSRAFRRLFSNESFRQLHEDLSAGQNYMGFDTMMLNPAEVQYIRAYSNRDKLCRLCMEAWTTGAKRDKELKLTRMRYCEGCKQEHIGAFFFHGDRQRQDRYGGKLTCIGRKADMLLCDHSGEARGTNRSLS